MGLLKEIDEQICKPCRQKMDDKDGFCDEDCPLYKLWVTLEDFSIEGKLSQAVELRKVL